MTDPWVAISYGALDVTHTEVVEDPSVELIVLPTQPSEPIGLQGEVAALWRQLVSEPVSDESLSAEQQTLVREFAEYGLASRDPQHPARMKSVPEPWLISPLHELVYALVASVGRDTGVDLIFIKGPALHQQGIRSREHSGDVDLWADLKDIDALSLDLIEWGWKVVPTIWGKLPPGHSLTLRPVTWGCEIDIHFDFPGVARSGKEVLELLRESVDSFTFAGVSAGLPSAAMHVVIHALHVSRPAIGDDRPPPPYPEGTRALRQVGSIALRMAQRLGADAALTPLLQVAFPEEFIPPAYEAPLNWEWRRQSSILRAYSMLFQLVPAGHRLTFLRRLIWPAKDAALGADKAGGGQSRTANQARWRRLMKGVRRLLADQKPSKRSPLTE